MLLNLKAMTKLLEERAVLGSTVVVRALVAWRDGRASQQDVGTLVLAGLARQVTGDVACVFEPEKLGQPKSSSTYLVGRRYALTAEGIEVLAAGEGATTERSRGGE